MGEVVLLGTARALPTIGQENTYMALVGAQETVLVDCAGSPVRRIREAGLDPVHLNTLILTHAHPDHVYGVPALLMGMWLAGRREPIDIYGLAATCDLMRQMFLMYQPERWPDMFEVRYHPVELQPGARVCETPDFEVVAAPVEHTVPALGLRITDRRTRQVLAYSGDTQPCAGIRFLANQANLLIHEATGTVAGVGHSSPAQAGTVAEEMGVQRLVLVHYDAEVTPPEMVEREARACYRGEVHAAHDFERFVW